MNFPPMSTILKQYAGFQAGCLDPTDEVRSSLNRAIEKRADHVFIKLTPERALAAAEQSARRFALRNDLGPLDGITIVWKDLFDQVGEVTTAGSKSRKSVPVAKSNAACVDLLENAGCCSLGRTNLSEFAFSGLGINPHFGTPANAISKDSTRIPGGSSSGSAVAVALNIATIGIGTDTSGSVRIPAALNGIVGFRPSQERYDRTGVFALSASLDTIGTFAKSVEDIALVDQILTKSSSRGRTSDLDRTIYDLSDSLDTEWDDDVYEKYLSTLRSYEQLGYKIKVKNLNVFRQAADLFQKYGVLVAIEAKRVHKSILEGPDRHLLDPMIAMRLRAAPVLSTPIYKEYLRKRNDAIVDTKSEIGTALVSFPTVPRTAPALSEISESVDIAARENARMLSNTMIASFLDLPGISMPTGSDKDGLPGSILLSCAQGNDEALLSHAKRL